MGKDGRDPTNSAELVATGLELVVKTAQEINTLCLHFASDVNMPQKQRRARLARLIYLIEQFPDPEQLSWELNHKGDGIKSKFTTVTINNFVPCEIVATYDWSIV